MGALVMLLAQTRRDCKETRAPFCTRVEYTRWDLCLLNAIRDAVLTTYKMAAQTHAVRCCFVSLENGRMRACRGRVYRPERPLALISLYDAYTCP